jgi:hypothetical protein
MSLLLLGLLFCDLVIEHGVLGILGWIFACYYGTWKIGLLRESQTPFDALFLDFFWGGREGYHSLLSSWAEAFFCLIERRRALLHHDLR